MTMDRIFSPVVWCALLGIEVLDPDGWDRSDFEASWARRITEAEFRERAAISTTRAIPADGTS